MVTKSLLQFSHGKIGAKTHKARTATAHVSYIMRSEAMTKFQCENMPDGGRGTRVFFDKLWEKAGSPESARICDKLMLALPLGLSQEERYEAVRSYMHELGQGRIAWCAAHHEDRDNPHTHVVFKDADITTGHKVIGTTTNARDVREAEAHGWKVPPRTTTADMRKMWCDHLNGFMERAGLDIRYDHRTFKERGIDREAQIHVGPKAQELEKKGYAFESQDHMRNGHNLPYTLIDEDSRAGHNKNIIARNKERELARDSSPKFGASRRDDPKMRELLEAQERARRGMYQEQQRDRDALRLAQDPARIEHRKWAKKLYAGARQKAFDTVEKQYAEKWTEVRSIKDLKARLETADALKIEQKKTYAEEASRQVQLCRPQKDAAFKLIYVEQEKERRELYDQHRQETSALARQHAAERQGLHEKRRTRTIEKRADRIDARLSSRQGMVAQQTAANDAIKLYKKATRLSPKAKDYRVPSANPREAYREFFNTAWVEQKRHTAIRQLLLKGRARNLERAGFGPERRDASAQRQAAHIASPREILAAAVQATRENRGSGLQQQLRDSDRQQQIREAAASGRALTGDERANASPEIREKLGREDQRSRQLSLFIFSKDGKQDRGKDGRTGGGRGR